MPGNIGWQGLVVILLVLLVVFGPKRLPELGRSLGRGMREFKDSVSGDHKDEHPPAPEHEIGRSPLPEPEALEPEVLPEARERDTVA
jgi:sec-independent protein translocase protein TatA